MEQSAVVIDNGTGFTKMGFAGNFEPSYIIPSMIAMRDQVLKNCELIWSVGNGGPIEELNDQPRNGFLHWRRCAKTQQNS